MSSYNLCIVGGGILGVSIAYHASLSHPQWRILLLDKGEIGHGASAYAAALSSTLATTPEVEAMSLASDAVYLQLQQRFPNVHIRDLPITYIMDQDEQPDFKTTSAVDEIDVNKLRDYIPLGDISGSVILRAKRALHIDASEVIAALISELKMRPNVSIQAHETVSSVDKESDTLLRVNTNKQQLQAHKVVLALGPWSLSSIASQELQQLGCRVKKIVAMTVNYAPHPDCPVICFPQQDAFLLPDLRNNNFLLSINSREWDIHPDDTQKRVITDEDRKIGYSVLEKYAPQLLPFYSDGRVFCDTYTQNGNPLIHQSSGIPQLFCVTGGNGRGVRLGPAIAKQVVDLLS